jgi:hypothetical protein
MQPPSLTLSITFGFSVLSVHLPRHLSAFPQRSVNRVAVCKAEQSTFFRLDKVLRLGKVPAERSSAFHQGYAQGERTAFFFACFLSKEREDPTHHQNFVQEEPTALQKSRLLNERTKIEAVQY